MLVDCLWFIFNQWNVSCFLFQIFSLSSSPAGAKCVKLCNIYCLDIALSKSPETLWYHTTESVTRVGAWRGRLRKSFCLCAYSPLKMKERKPFFRFLPLVWKRLNDQHWQSQSLLFLIKFSSQLLEGSHAAPNLTEGWPKLSTAI